MKKKNFGKILTGSMAWSVLALAISSLVLAAENPVSENSIAEKFALENSTEENVALENLAVEESVSDKSSQVAEKSEMAAIQDVVEEWMVPIYADELQDGSYEIEADSSSTMFKVENCVLTVKDGSMTAVMTMGGKGYLHLYMGTGEEAVEADEASYISYMEAEDGRHTYEVPVEALDCGISCAAFSKSREKWYDRTLVFRSTSLPIRAFKNLDWTAIEELALEDGSYEVEVKLEGGSGKTQVESPAKLYVEAGLVMAEIVFQSSNYDYVIVDGEKSFRLNEEGNSSFLIPVAGMDYPLPIVADSIALGTPREIDYTITFDSSSIIKEE